MEINKSITTHKYIWLDLIRAVAALEVFLGHLRTILFQNYWNGKSGIFKNIFYFFTGFSHEAVIIFFVLSGFFITDAVVRAKEKGKFSLSNYAIDRLSRLWIVLIPGLVLTLIVDLAGLHFFGSTPAYLGTIRYTGNINVLSQLTWVNFLGNAFFLQNILVSTFGSNSPLWSLSNEFWYYVLFPLIMMLFWKGKIISKILVLLTLAGLCVFTGFQMTLYFSIWLLGSALVFVKRNLPEPGKTVKNLILFCGLLIFSIFLYKLRVSGSSNFSKDFIAGMLTAILCYRGIYAEITVQLPKKIISFFSGLSYSLYVVHLPLCLFLTSIFSATQKQWSVPNFGLYLLVALLVFSLAVLFWFLFESRYMQFRNYLKKKIYQEHGKTVSGINFRHPTT